MVIVPLSIVGNWLDEFASFSPMVTTKKYLGNKVERATIRSEIISFIREQPKEARVRQFP